jgi:hypothetical protein
MSALVDTPRDECNAYSQVHPTQSYPYYTYTLAIRHKFPLVDQTHEHVAHQAERPFRVDPEPEHIIVKLCLRSARKAYNYDLDLTFLDHSVEVR